MQFTKSLILIGAGNANLVLLKMLRMKFPKDTKVTLIHPENQSFYSAIFPAFLTGNAKETESKIDVNCFATSLGVEFLRARATGVDPEKKMVHLEGRPSLRYDFVSINCGAVPKAPEGAVSLRPLSGLYDNIKGWDERSPGFHLAIVGGGGSGCEIALALTQRWEGKRFQISLYDSGHRLERKSSEAVSERLKRQLEERGVKVFLNRRIESAAGLADAVLWATQGDPAISFNALPKDAQGFLKVNSFLQVEGLSTIFATGDCISVRESEGEYRNGVFAVRQGRVLAKNILALLLEQPLTPYHFRQNSLTIFDLSNGEGIFRYGKGVLTSKWSLKQKRTIDKRWMDGFVPQAMTSDMPMRCGGCASKIGPEVLFEGLGNVIGDGEDAAIVKRENGRVEVQTIDYFKTLVSDPFVFGKLAAVHALQDCYAMNAKPKIALALAGLPYQKNHLQKNDLDQMTKGALSVFEKVNVKLAGGHTSETETLSLGFNITGEGEEKSLFLKKNLKVGDKLILTKPLGSGALFAAYQKSQCSSEWIEKVIQSLLLLSDRAAEIAENHGVTAATDVTGFGLAGHLLEMLRASHVSARLFSAEVPVYEGFHEVVLRGIVSTLHPENAKFAPLFEGNLVGKEWLFDPQTCGGLLLSVSPENASSLVSELRTADHVNATIIGEVLPRGDHWASLI